MSFFAYYRGLLRSVSLLTILGPPQVNFFAYYIEAPLQFSFFAYCMGQVCFFAHYIGGPLRSVSSLTIGGPFSSVSSYTIRGPPQINFFAY